MRKHSGRYRQRQRASANQPPRHEAFGSDGSQVSLTAQCTAFARTASRRAGRTQFVIVGSQRYALQAGGTPPGWLITRLDTLLPNGDYTFTARPENLACAETAEAAGAALARMMAYDASTHAENEV